VICKQRQQPPLIPNVIGMLSHRQNLRVFRGRRWVGRGEARSREHVKFIKTTLYYLF
jgi:hypothetical protein